MAEFLDQVIKRFNGEMGVIQPRPQARFETPVVEDIDNSPTDETENTFVPYAAEIPTAKTSDEEKVSMHISPSREASPADQPVNSPAPSLEVKERREVSNIEHRRIVVERVVDAREYDSRSFLPPSDSSAHESDVSEPPILSKDVDNDKLDFSHSDRIRTPARADDFSNQYQTDDSEVTNEGYGEWQQLRNPSEVEEEGSENRFRDRKGQRLSDDIAEGPLNPIEQIDDSFPELGVAEANDAHTHEERAVTINIGRIEIGQTKPQPEPVKAHIVERAKPAMTLEQYLRARAGDPS